MEPQVDPAEGSPVPPEERWVDALLRGHAPLPAVLRWLATTDEQADPPPPQTAQHVTAGEAQRAVRVAIPLRRVYSRGAWVTTANAYD
jgi:hypothetical protein